MISEMPLSLFRSVKTKTKQKHNHDNNLQGKVQNKPISLTQEQNCRFQNIWFRIIKFEVKK